MPKTTADFKRLKGNTLRGLILAAITIGWWPICAFGQIDSKNEELTGKVEQTVKLPPEQQAKFNQLVEQGEEAFELGNYEKAKSVFESVNKQFPAFPISYVALGRIAFLKGEVTQAIKLFETALKVAPTNVDAHFELGSARFATGQIEQAIDELTAAAESAPDRADIGYKLAMAKQFSPSYRSNRRSRPSDKVDVVTNPELNYRLLASGRIGEAIQQASQAIAMEPTSAQLHYQLGSLYKSAGDTKQAESEFREAIKIDPDHLDALEQLVHLYASRRDFQGAAPFVDRWAELAPDNPAPHFFRSLRQMRAKDYAGALASLDTVANLDPSNIEVMNYKGIVLTQFDRFEEAASQFSRAIALSPQSYDPKLNLATLLTLVQIPGQTTTARATKARELLNSLPQTAASAPEVKALKSLIEAKLNNFEDASALAKDALAAKPPTASGMTTSSSVTTSSINTTSVATTSTTTSGTTVSTRTKSTSTSAPTPLPTKISLGVYQPYALMALALVQKSLGQPDKQIEYLSEARKLAPKDLFIANELIEARLAQGQYASAVELAKSTLEDHPNSAKLKELYAISLARAGKQAEALTFLENLKKSDPTNLQWQYATATVQRIAGNTKEASKTLQRMLDLYGSKNDDFTVTTLASLAEMAMNNKQNKEAIAFAEHLVAIPSGTQRGHLLLGEIYFRMGKYTQSMAEVKKAQPDLSKALPDESLLAARNSFKLKRWKDTVDSYKNGVTSSAANTQDWLMMAKASEKLKNLSEAKSVLQLALKSHPDDELLKSEFNRISRQMQ